MNLIKLIAVGIIIAVVVAVIVRATRGSGTRRPTSEAPPAELLASPDPVAQPAWTRTIERGETSVTATRIEDRGASNRYRIDMRSPAADDRSLEVLVPDWLPDTIVLDDEIRYLAFVREDEELRDFWETRVHVLDLTSGSLVLSAVQAGRCNSATLSATELIVSTDRGEERHGLPPA